MQEHDKVDELLRKIELQWNSIEALEHQVKKKKALMHVNGYLNGLPIYFVQIE